jgi:hypothetical protein
MYGPLRFIRIITHGFEHWEKWYIYLFSELINFMGKIILEKSKIII